MNKNIQLTFAFGLSGALLGASLSVPLQAQDAMQDGENILVQPRASHFAASVAEQLNSEFFRGAYPSASSGIVRVRFFVNGNGAAENVTLFEGSGNRQIDHSAMRAVGQIEDLGSLPIAAGGRQEILATIIYAQTHSEAERLSRRAMRDNAVLMADARLNPQILAVLVGAGNRS